MRSFYLIIVMFLLSMQKVTAQNDVYKFAQFGRYDSENTNLTSAKEVKDRVVFMGNSITENWFRIHPDFFKNNNFIGRGISGQTSYQYLLRFRQDVINLYPEVVVINAGTNDIAENTGTYNEDFTFGNIVSMVEIAKANKIKVILTSTLPAASFGWNPSIKDSKEKIISLNNRVREYARKNKIKYVDYYSAMVSGDNCALNPDYSNDGVHPTAEGYLIMEALISKAIDKVK